MTPVDVHVSVLEHAVRPSDVHLPAPPRPFLGARDQPGVERPHALDALPLEPELAVVDVQQDQRLALANERVSQHVAQRERVEDRIDVELLLDRMVLTKQRTSSLFQTLIHRFRELVTKNEVFKVTVSAMGTRQLLDYAYEVGSLILKYHIH